MKTLWVLPSTHSRGAREPRDLDSFGGGNLVDILECGSVDNSDIMAVAGGIRKSGSCFFKVGKSNGNKRVFGAVDSKDSCEAEV